MSLTAATIGLITPFAFTLIHAVLPLSKALFNAGANSSLFVTNTLVKELKTEERKKIELWAQATKHLVSLTGEGDYSLAIKVISENNNVPVILVDACDSILENRNFQNFTKTDSFLLVSSS